MRLAIIFILFASVAFGQNSGVIVLGNANGGNDTLTVTKVSIFNNTTRNASASTSATMSYEEEVVNQCGITLGSGDTVFTVPVGGYIVDFTQSIETLLDGEERCMVVLNQTGSGEIAASYYGIGSANFRTYINVTSESTFWVTAAASSASRFGDLSNNSGQIIFTKIR